MGFKPRKKKLPFDRDEYFELVEKHARARMKELGEKFNDVDFALGACVILDMFDEMDRMPGKYVFAPMLGHPIWDE